MPLLTKSEMHLYSAIKSRQISVICKTRQWSGLNEGEVTDWIYANFKDVEGKYLATKLLLHCLYYSEENIIELLRYGLYERILGVEIKNDLIKKGNIYVAKSEIEADVLAKVNKVLFVPLLDSNKPSESGNAIARLLNQKLSIPNSNISFHFNLTESSLTGFDKIIIVDDCVGSGGQLDDFWNSSGISHIKDLAIQRGIKFYYLALVAYENSIFDLQIDGRLKDLRVIICEALNNEHRIFSGKHIIWNSQEELDFANNYFDFIETHIGVPKLGYNDLDFAVFLHNSVPDWSLPIFWMEIEGQWKALVKRKNSNS